MHNTMTYSPNGFENPPFLQPLDQKRGGSRMRIRRDGMAFLMILDLVIECEVGALQANAINFAMDRRQQGVTNPIDGKFDARRPGVKR